MTAPTQAYSHDRMCFSQDGRVECTRVAPGFLAGWSWNELKIAYALFVSDFKAHYPGEPLSKAAAAFDVLAVLMATIGLGECAWEQVKND